MKRHVCIHGHFYQPPRENPWLEEIERQESAYPHHDWNQRITAECYAPNSASRILDDQGRIVDIVNNYRRISFNFGPTLLSWMEEHEPGLYSTVLTSDRQGREDFSGHGPALAQAYNHIILPLANSEDKKTQIIWGFKDFQHRFQRRPEGMWLPETAVDMETLEILADQGLRFTILAPHQAVRVRKIGRDDWRDVSGGRIDPRRAYLCRLPSGRDIALFFYNGPLAHGIAFGDLLKKGALLAERILEAFVPERDEAQLVHLATDGETFGHHHRFGEMALAFGLRTIAAKNNARITVYAEYLKNFPPAWEVEILENTSWSCPHGVERWRSSCGCHAGTHHEWSQSWRTPLRQAMDWLRDQLAPLYEETLRDYSVDPWELRNGYIDVILDRSESGIKAFFKSQGLDTLSPRHKTRVLKALEMQRASNLMYTSCGWFFDDIARIESLQVMAYAARALQLAGDLGEGRLEKEYRLRLHQARSNDPAARNGAHLYSTKIEAAALDLDKVGAHLAVSSLFREYPADFRIGIYSVRKRGWERMDRGASRLSAGTAEVRSLATGEDRNIHFAAFCGRGLDVKAGVASGEKPFPVDQHREGKIQAFEEGDIPALIELLERSSGPRLHTFAAMFKDGRREALDRLLFGGGLKLEKLQRAAHDMRTRGAPLDELPLTMALEHKIENVMAELPLKPFDSDILKQALILLQFGRDLRLELNLRKSQAIYFGIAREYTLRTWRDKPRAGERETDEWRGRMSALGRALYVTYPHTDT
jgi:alpha-amylase/alpha-mannosidase (GH57 family)